MSLNKRITAFSAPSAFGLKSYFKIVSQSFCMFSSVWNSNLFCNSAIIVLLLPDLSFHIFVKKAAGSPNGLFWVKERDTRDILCPSGCMTGIKREASVNTWPWRESVAFCFGKHRHRVWFFSYRERDVRFQNRSHEWNPHPAFEKVTITVGNPYNRQ